MKRKHSQFLEDIMGMAEAIEQAMECEKFVLRTPVSGAETGREKRYGFLRPSIVSACAVRDKAKKNFHTPPGSLEGFREFTKIVNVP